MKTKVIILLLIFSGIMLPQSSFQSFLGKVFSVSDPAKRTSIVDSFMAASAVKGFPYIENNTANFIYRGSVSSVAVSGDFNNWGSSDLMSNISGTNFYYLTKTFELNARLDYKYILNGNNWILDPINPNTVLGGYGPNSELAMPGYIQPWEIKYYNNVKHGTLDSYTIFSKFMNTNYQVKVYLPYFYPVMSSLFASVYFQDGFEYIDLAGAVNVLDNLLDSMKIEKVIAVFVKPNNRNEEYAGSIRNNYQQFFVKELVPFIDSIYHTYRQPSKRLVLGDSYGANISALISYNYPETFGNCGLQSGAFQPNNYEALNLLTNGVVKNIKYSSVWGSYEGVYPYMRQLRDYWAAYKYQYDWGEYPEGHSWGLWRANLDKLLTYIFPFGAVNVKSEKTSGINNYGMIQNYPNPFNPETTIEYTTTKPGLVKLIICDMLGKNNSELINEYKNAGTYKVILNAGKLNLTSGVYFFKLEVNGYTSVKKAIYLK